VGGRKRNVGLVMELGIYTLIRFQEIEDISQDVVIATVLVKRKLNFRRHL